MTMASPFYFMATIILVVGFLSQAADFLIPIAIAFLLWFMIDAFADALARHIPFLRVRGWLPVLLASLLLATMVGAAGSAIFSTFAELSTDLAQARVKIEGLVNSFLSQLDLPATFSLPDKIQSALSEILSQIIASVRLVASDGSTILIYVLFLFADQPFFDAKMRAIFPDQSRRQQIDAMLTRIAKDIRTYLYLMTLVSLLTGLGTYIICEAFGVSAAIFWAFLAFLLNYIPTVGTILGIAFPSLFALATFDSTGVVLALALCLFAVQFLLGNVLLPRLMGSRLDISEFVVILSLFGWGAIWGVTGMLLSVPLTVILMIFLNQFPSTRKIALALSKTGHPIGSKDAG